MKVLVISPQAGMGNRFRAMAAAAVLARQTGRTLLHAWPSLVEGGPVDKGRSNVAVLQRAGFEGFFEKGPELATLESVPKVDVCFSEWGPSSGWYKVQSSAQRYWGVAPRVVGAAAADHIAKCDEDAVLLETSLPVRLSFGLTDSEWDKALSGAYEGFVPHARFLENADGAPTAEIGMFVRRREFLHYFKEARQDLGELGRWAAAVSRDRSIAIFSDDEEAQSLLRSMVRPESLISPSLGREVHTLEKWQADFVEFLYLSRCGVVTGTPVSSFAREAARFGGRPFFQNLDSSVLKA